MSLPGVLAIHDIIYHKYGMTCIISLHIEVSDKESAFALHELSEEVEAAIGQLMGAMVTVHIDPINKEHPRYEAIARALQDIVGRDERVSSFHDLRIVGASVDKCKVVFDISLEQSADERKTGEIARDIDENFTNEFPEMKTVIKVEPKYAYNLKS